jgi:lipopolysaccharide export system protein LptA
MRFTIERLRTLVLIAGVLLIVALGVFLGIAKWRNPFNKRDLPQKLGANIRQEANGWTYTHELHGHTLYKIHASKLVQLKQGSHVLLHDVRIELYGEDGTRSDRIEGSEFEYDPEGGIAKAAGPVEITLMKPGAAPAIAGKASAAKPGKSGTPLKAASRGEIAVKTSGLTFDRNSGQASTDQKVEFAQAQGVGSAVGASYDAHAGRLILDHAVQMLTQRGDGTVVLNAQHAEFDRDHQACDLVSASLGYRDGGAKAERARLYFRDDGTVLQVEASQGILLTSSTGGQVSAPTGVLEFNEQNEPRQGQLWGGVTVDSDRDGRKVHGTAPTIQMRFEGQGELRAMHLERNVQFAVDEQTGSSGALSRLHRTWASPVADLEFRSPGRGKVEPSSIHGTGGVVVTATSQRGDGPVVPSRMAADDVTGAFGPGGQPTAMTGTGNASIFQTTATGSRQTTSGDNLVTHFSHNERDRDKSRRQAESGMLIESATIDGNVVLTQEPPAKAGAPAPVPLRATAVKAVYEGDGEWLHLTGSPRIVNGGLELTADRVDVSQASGDAFAHGDVKATWIGDKTAGAGEPKSGQGRGDPAFGGQGPTHVVADEAQLHQPSGQATFKGNARLWQQTNSISAPVIGLDRTKQTLTARGTSASAPVQVALVSATGAARGKQSVEKESGPSVIRVRGGDLKYSSAERTALMLGGSAGNVVATTADANTSSSELELILLPPGNHAGKDGAAAQVDRMTSSGHVEVASQGRRGIGEKLVYSGETGNYVLTGTASMPPRITDPTRGTVTGEALIFSGRDDSVSIEGGGIRTTTVTTAPK